MMDGEDVSISSSKLGTKEYWDSRYDMELNNFNESGDEGELWFGRAAENRILKYLIDSKTDKRTEILDLGCGNGSVLRRLREKGFTHLTGVDYCPAAVELARATAKAEDDDEEPIPEIRFEVVDVLSEDSLQLFRQQYGVVLDKGTWDAMSLSDDRESRRVSYRAAVSAALATDGLLVIFSCNFTCEELRGLFEGDELSFECEVPASHVITFGGQKGVTSSGAVFRKN